MRKAPARNCFSQCLHSIRELLYGLPEASVRESTTLHSPNSGDVNPIALQSLHKHLQALARSFWRSRWVKFAKELTCLSRDSLLAPVFGVPTKCLFTRECYRRVALSQTRVFTSVATINQRVTHRDEPGILAPCHTVLPSMLFKLFQATVTGTVLLIEKQIPKLKADVPPTVSSLPDKD